MNTRKMNAVLIIGCGWVGKKLGQHLTKKNIKVFGTTRSSSNFSELNAHDINPVKLELPVAKLSDIRLPEADTVLISIAPGRGENRSQYPKSVGQLAQVLAESNTQVIMYSSTSVYENAKNEVTEDDVIPKKSSKNEILAAEGELRKYCPDAVILRLCGLYGEDRHPATHLAGRKDISDGDSPVNLIHRDDVIQVTEKVISENIRSEIFNVCSKSHPTRKEIYTKIAKRLELKKPVFLDGGEDGKVVSSKKLNDQFSIKFIHPNPEEYLAE